MLIKSVKISMILINVKIISALIFNESIKKNKIYALIFEV